MNLKFAFAVNNVNEFEKKHFGDAHKFLIYEQVSDELVLSSEEINNFKILDQEHGHCSKEKVDAVIKFLKEKDVNVLVSVQFGKNIKRINEHFIPVKITLTQTGQIIKVIIKYLNWIKDEWKNNSSGFKLFTIKSGILKSSIEK